MRLAHTSTVEAECEPWRTAMAKRSSKREVIKGAQGKSYARRSASGQFKEMEGAGRASAADQKRRAKLRRRAGKGIAAIVAEHQAAPDGIQDVEWAREAPPECRLLDTCSSDAPLIQASGRGTSIAQALVLALDNVRRGVRRRLTGVYPAAAFVPRVTLVPHHGAEAG